MGNINLNNNTPTAHNRWMPEESEKILVSVIIPTYNRSQILTEALDSVWAQTYRPIELIVVDDCSTDDTGRVVEAWCNGHQDNNALEGFTLKFIRSEINRGPGASRESGRLQASGDYLCYLDSDDLWHPAKIEKQLALLRQSPDAGMCYCSSKEFSTLPFDGNEQLRNRSDQSFSTFLPTILSGRPWGTAACMWTRQATDRIGPWFPGRVYEDFEYDGRAGCHDIRIIFLPDVLCYFRFRKTSDEDFRKGRVLEVPAMLSLAQTLDRFGKLADSTTNVRLIGQLYIRGLWLIINGDENPGKEYLNQILHLSATTRRMNVWLRAVIYLGSTLHTNLVARLAKKIGPTLFI